MANISITTKCNKKCRYCFASNSDNFMEGQTFEQTLDFLERSGIKEVRILGGEPTLHPGFSVFVRAALNRGFGILLFSNGYMPESALCFLEELPAEKVKILVNVVTNPESFDGLDKRLVSLFQRLNTKTIPGLNIDTPSIQLDFLLDIVLGFNTMRKVRLGLAHPKAEGGNHFLHPRYYPAVGRKIAEFSSKARPYGVGILFDCGFVPCMFPESSFSSIGPEMAELGKRCNPILDILPDGQVASCFPLASLQQEMLREDLTDTELRNVFSKKQETFRSMMLYKKCSNCTYRQHGHCTGGCLSASMQRQRFSKFTLTMPDCQGTLLSHFF